MTAQEFQDMVAKSNAGVRKIKRHSSPEHNLQVECVNWFRNEYPHFYNLLASVPNGGYRCAATARIMKAEGQLSGWPDLQLMIPSPDYHGLFIEMKKSEVGKKGGIVGKGRLSERQEEVHADLRAAGYKVEVCYTFEQFQGIIRDYLS